MRNKQYAAAYNAAFSKYGVTMNQFNAALKEAQNRAGFFGTMRGKHRNATYLSDALTRMQSQNKNVARAQSEASAAETNRLREQQRQAAAAADEVARNRRQDNEDDNEPPNTGNEYNFDSSQSFGVGASGGMSGALAEGGRVGLALGGQPPDAPAGFVEGRPEEFTDKEKVADDKPMAVNEGTLSSTLPL